LRELVAQRVFAIACGYPDANDSARLSEDPIHKLLLDRDPIEGRALAAQPTLSRFENGVGLVAIKDGRAVQAPSNFFLFFSSHSNSGMSAQMNMQ
jgi:hypothetical protein